MLYQFARAKVPRCRAKENIPCLAERVARYRRTLERIKWCAHALSFAGGLKKV